MCVGKVGSEGICGRDGDGSESKGELHGGDGMLYNVLLGCDDFSFYGTIVILFSLNFPIDFCTVCY
jgi:hypothetical protein